MENSLKRSLLWLGLAMAMAQSALGYVYLSSQASWLPGLIPMKIMVGTSPVLTDGSNYSSSAQAGMQTWNSHLGVVQFQPQIVAVGGPVDSENDIYFDSMVEGDAFGSGVLAVTLIYTTPSIRQIIETDIIFNTAYTWDSYPGVLQTAEDFRRVVIHELGHVLGLSHPDENGQLVSALMNSHVSNLDSLTVDDIAGAQSLYRANGQTSPPVNDTFADATLIVLGSGSIQTTGHSFYATKEAGEPDHDPGDGVGGASVWWKWTAPANGSMTLTTEGSHFDTLLGVYTGAAVGGLTLIGANDDLEPEVIRFSSLTFATTAGTTYHIAVDGWDGESGIIALRHSFVPTGATAVGWGSHDFGQTITPPGLGSLKKLVAGTRYTVALKVDGTVAAWGENSYGRTTVPAGLDNVVALAAGNTHVLALKADGTVAAWGENTFGSPGPAATPPAGLNQVVAVAAGFGSSMALRSDGTVVSWVGPSQPANLRGVVAIASGAFHCLALKSDGTVVGWGDNSNDAATPPAGLGNVIAIDAGGSASGGHSLALRADGTVVAWGYNISGQCNVPAGLNDVVAISAGGDFSVARKADGAIVAWGRNDQGQLDIPTQAGGFMAVEAGYDHTAALVVAQLPVITTQPTSLTINLGETARFAVVATGTAPLSYRWKFNGELLTDGGDISGSASPTLQITNAQAAVVGSYTVEVGNAGGTVTSNAAALSVATPSPITVHPASRIVAEGGSASFAVAASAGGPFTYQWRHNRSAIPGATGATLDLAAVSFADHGYYDVIVTNAAGGVSRSVFYLHVAVSNPAVVVWGASPPAPPLITGSIASIELGGALFAVKGDGTVVAWGPNSAGQATVPVGLSDVVSVASGENFTLALKADGTVVGWGDNSYGAPTPPVGLGEVVAIAAGPNHGLALKSDGTMVGWGDSSYGQHIIPAGLKEVVAMKTGRFKTLALKADGTMVEWGNIFGGASTFPGPAGSVTAIANGESHALAIREDGTVAAWGSDYSGSTVVPAGLNNVVAIAAGDSHGLAVKSDGTVIGWGRDYEEQATPPAGLAGVMTVAAGGWRSMALLRATIPTIVNSPPDRSVNDGEGATFAISASAAGTIVYQWQRMPAGDGSWSDLSNTANYSGVMTNALTITGATLAMSGDQFRCQATNAAGTASSGAATLTVSLPLPVIVTQPLSQSVTIGVPVSFTVIANSPFPLSYQWQKNGTDIGGQTTDSFSIASAQLTDAANYTVVVTSSVGSVTSQVAELTVQPLLISTYSGISANADGSLVTLSIAVAGAGAFSYQWYEGLRGDVSHPIAGGNTASLTVPQGSGQAYYWVRVSNGFDSVDSASIPIGKWTRIDPLFGTAELSATAYGAGKHVVVGTTVGYSANAIEWKKGTIEAGINLQAVLFDGSRFVAGGVRGQIFISDDGITWTNQRPADAGQYDTDILQSVATGNGITVFASGQSKVMSSTNGTDWEWRPVSVNGADVYLRSVAFGAGRFVAAGQNGAYKPVILQSVDGINWTPCPLTLTPFANNYSMNGISQVAYFGGRFIALGQLQTGGVSAYYMTSADGVSWTVPAFTSTQVSLNRMAVGNGLLLSGDIRSSADGINWSDPLGSPTQYLGALGYGDGTFLALGSRYNPGYASIVTSTDLTNWTARVGYGIPKYICYGDGRFVAVGDEMTGYSLDGMTWTVSRDGSINDPGSVTYGNGLYVSVSTYTGYGISHYTSADGLSWTARSAKINGYTLSFSKVIYAGGQWLANGYGAIYGSADAIEWSFRYYSPSFSILAITHGAGRFVAVGSQGGVAISDDGIIWQEPARPDAETFRQVIYGNGLFVAATDYSIWTSPDGLYWTARPLPLKNGGSYAGYISGLAYGGGRFVANYGNDLLSSSDGVAWLISPDALQASVGGNYFTGELIYAADAFWAAAPSFYSAVSWLQAPAGPGQPEIVASPDSVVIANGATATISVIAAGSGLSYQWFQGASGDTANPIDGATGSTFTTAALTQSANFWVRVTGASGIVNSATASVTVSIAPTITQQPVDLEILASATANLTVIASGTPAPAYQWYVGNPGDTSQPVANATSASLTVSPMPTATRYWVRVSNSAGSVDSAIATVTPWTAMEPLLNQFLGGVAHGSGRWVVSGSGTNDHYSDDGVNWLPTASAFGGQAGGEVTYGNGVFLSVDSDQPGGLWRSADGSNWQLIYVPGADSTFNNVSFAGGLLFAVGVDGQFATSLDGANWDLHELGVAAWLQDMTFGNGQFVLSAGTRTYVSTDLVTWQASPLQDINIYGLAHGLGVFVAVGGGNQGKILTSPDGLTWTETYSSNSNGINDVAFDGRRFAVAASEGIILSDDGLAWTLWPYSDTVQIAVGAGSFMAVGRVNSWKGGPGVASDPVIHGQPSTQGCLIGQEVTFSIQASGGNLAYQWLKDGSPIIGATSHTLTLPTVVAGDEGRYSVEVTGDGLTVSSEPAILALIQPPILLTQPLSMAVDFGDPASFEIEVGSGEFSAYTWYKDGQVIAGSTEPRHTIMSAQAADQGHYQVRVMNSAGFVLSAEATLTVRMPPIIIQQPVSQQSILGHPVSFTVVASSDYTLFYAWDRSIGGVGPWGSVPLDGNYSGLMSPTLTVVNPTVANQGDLFRCRVINSAGSVTSQSVSLTVDAAGFLKISAGRYHSLRLDQSAQLFSTGTNTHGQLGDGGTTNIATPQVVTIPGQTLADIAAGAQHSLFLTSAGQVWATGFNQTGQLGDGTNAAQSTPALLTTNAVGIAAAIFHSAVLKADGTLWTTGGNDSGQLGNGSTTDTNVLSQVAADVVDLAAGIRQSFYLKSDGTLWGMGDMNGSGVPVSTPVQIATNVKAVAAGGYHSLFLKTDGTLWALGYNPFGQLGTGDTADRTSPVQVATGVKAIATGYFHSAFIKTDGSLWLMGYNSSGQLGDGTTTNRPTPFQLATNVTAVSASEAYTLYTKNDGSLWGTGYNAYGQFGNGGTVVTTSLVQIATGVILAPEAPAGLTATASVSFDRVRLLWTPQGSAASYEVWRHSANNSASATLLASGLRWPLFEDRSVALGQAYYYWIKAVNPAGSTISAPANASTGASLSQTITFTGPLDQPYTATPLTLTASASSGLPVSFSLLSGPANLTGDQLTLTGVGTVSVRASQAGDASFDAAPNVDRSFAVTANFDSWELGFFTTPELADANVSGPNADPDGDGYANLVEYALGLEPRISSTAGLPEVTADATHWIYTYTRPEGRTDVTIAIEVSTDLSGWAAPTVAEVLVSTSGGIETWQAKQPLTSANAFFRLKVSQP